MHVPLYCREIVLQCFCSLQHSASRIPDWTVLMEVSIFNVDNNSLLPDGSVSYENPSTEERPSLWLSIFQNIVLESLRHISFVILPVHWLKVGWYIPASEVFNAIILYRLGYVHSFLYYLMIRFALLLILVHLYYRYVIWMYEGILY